MAEKRGTIAIIGGGIAGLCAAVYARRCGYRVTVLERYSNAGGLATSWPRSGYTFETCLHWLPGSRPGALLNARWNEVLDLAQLTFINPEEYVRVIGTQGEQLPIYSNIKRMEEELLWRSPKDTAETRRLAATLRRLARLRLRGGIWPPGWTTLIQNVTCLPLLRRLSAMTTEEYGNRFEYPLIRAVFGGPAAGMTVLALLFSLAWMSEGNAGYPIGGSRAVIRLLLDTLEQLGAEIRLGAPVSEILVQDGAATGVKLLWGETVPADWVISAADGHATIYDLLGGRYVDAQTQSAYDDLTPFPSYVQVSFGVGRDLSSQPAHVLRLLADPLRVDPATVLDRVSFRIFNFDPTFAPPGKTAVTCLLPTRNFSYWQFLKGHDLSQYESEKQRLATSVAVILQETLPGAADNIEVVDVSTPASVIEATGNWQGSMEGWLPTPDRGLRMLRNSLPGLRQFLMAGQWVMPGGGLPAGLLTARAAIQTVCRQDRVPFLPPAQAREHHAA